MSSERPMQGATALTRNVSNLAAGHGDTPKNLQPPSSLMGLHLSPRTRFKQKLGNSIAFKQSRPEFIALLVQDATEKIVDAGQVVFRLGDVCHFGATPFYVVLEGQMTVENALEVVLGFVYDGEMFGEGGAIGLTEERTVTVRACKTKPCHILRIEGSALEAAVVAFPEERDSLEEHFYRQQTMHQDFEARREAWVSQTVIPGLAGTALLAGCPDDFLYDVAAPLLEKTYKDGQTIAVCGEPADSMLLLLEGTLEVEAKNGSKIVNLRDGASFGEVAALDLFPLRTATVRAVGRCRVLNVTSQALNRAISNSSEEVVRVAFSRLVQSRCEQVQKGLPMCALPINAKPDDVCVRAVALQAERIDLAPGQAWLPLPDHDACGPHFGVLVKGKAVLETVEERRLVTVLGPGSLFPEGMAAEYRTHLRAVTHCEGYRVRQVDFLVGVYSMPSAQDWFYRFRLLDKQTREHLRARLSAVRGVTDGVQHRSSDDDIHEWKTRRQKAIERARRLKVQTAGAAAKLPSMASLPAHSFMELNPGGSLRSSAKDSLYRASSTPNLRSAASSPNSSKILPKLRTAA